jgi:hypothetical protein
MRGWHYESWRHSLASKGVKTYNARKYPIEKMMPYVLGEELELTSQGEFVAKDPDEMILVGGPKERGEVNRLARAAVKKIMRSGVKGTERISEDSNVAYKEMFGELADERRILSSGKGKKYVVLEGEESGLQLGLKNLPRKQVVGPFETEKDAESWRRKVGEDEWMRHKKDSEWLGGLGKKDDGYGVRVVNTRNEDVHNIPEEVSRRTVPTKEEPWRGRGHRLVRILNRLSMPHRPITDMSARDVALKRSYVVDELKVPKSSYPVVRGDDVFENRRYQEFGVDSIFPLSDTTYVQGGRIGPRRRRIVGFNPLAVEIKRGLREESL